MRASWVLDDRGDCWPEASRNLGLALNSKRSGADLTMFLVSQMGFVVIREHGIWTEIKFDPDTVSPIALTSIFYWSSDRAFLPTSVSATAHARSEAASTGAASVAQIFRSRLALLNHVGALIEQRSPRPAFECHEVVHDMSAFKGLWREAVDVCRSPINVHRKVELLQLILPDMFSISERGPSGDYEIVHASHVMKQRDPNMCLGEQRSFRGAYDRDFGQWSADHLLKFKADDDVVIESVSAAVAFSDKTRQRYAYDRMIVPTELSAGRDALFLAATVR